MKQIIGTKRYYDIIHLGHRTFLNLFSLLRDRDGLRSTQRATIKK